MSLEMIFFLLLFVPLAVSVLFGDFICGLIMELIENLLTKIRHSAICNETPEPTPEPIEWEYEEWARILENPEAF